MTSTTPNPMQNHSLSDAIKIDTIHARKIIIKKLPQTRLTQQAINFPDSGTQFRIFRAFSFCICQNQKHNINGSFLENFRSLYRYVPVDSKQVNWDRRIYSTQKKNTDQIQTNSLQKILPYRYMDSNSDSTIGCSNSTVFANALLRKSNFSSYFSIFASICGSFQFGL